MKLVPKNTTLQICTSTTAIEIAYISKMVLNYEVQTILQDMYQNCRLLRFIIHKWPYKMTNTNQILK
jgi:hypothetical protein